MLYTDMFATKIVFFLFLLWPVEGAKLSSVPVMT